MHSKYEENFCGGAVVNASLLKQGKLSRLLLVFLWGLFSFNAYTSFSDVEQPIEKKIERKYIGVFEKSEPLPITSDWHETQEKKLIMIYRELQKLDQESKRNVATFRVRIMSKGNLLGVQGVSDIFFVSGGNTGLLGNLTKKISESRLDELKQAKFMCIGDYCPPEPDKPSDFGLRSNIVTFFNFKEKLDPVEKDSLESVFRTSLKERIIFEEFSLKEKALKKLTDAYRSTLDGRFFKDESNEHAKQLKLINKTEKGGEFNHINDLFGQNFQLNFADSEQAIRLFLNQGSQNKTDWQSNIFDDLIKHLSIKENIENIILFEKEDNVLKNIKKNYGLVEEIEKQELLVRSSQIPINEIINKFIEGLHIEIDVASYYDMCPNCQATFLYDILERRQIQKNVFAKVLKEVSKSKDKDIDKARSYLVYSLLTSENIKDNAFLWDPRVSLLVSGLERY
jgi:hypothetical protein